MTSHLTPEEVAQLSGRSERHERRLAASGFYGDVSRRKSGRNNRSIRIPVDALPLDLRSRFFEVNPHLAPRPEESDATMLPPPIRSWSEATDAQRQRAAMRQAAVVAWELFLSEWGSQRGLTAAKRRWVAQYLLQHPQLGSLSVDTIERWTTRYRAFDRDGLVDGNDGHSRRGQTVIPREALAFFHARYLDKDAPPSIARAIEETRLAASESGWRLPAADDAFYRYVRSLPPALKLARRDGVDTPSQFLPFVARAMDKPYRTLQSDHHIADVFVNCEGEVCERTEAPQPCAGHRRHATGAVVYCGDRSDCQRLWCRGGHRPWITPMFDVGSRKVVSYQVSLEVPNAERILRAFRLAVEENGLPHRFYVDNGKDFKRAAEWKTRKAAVEEYLGNRMRALGLDVVFAKPYNAQAKAIERFFGTLVERRWRGTEGYAGRLGKRSERTKHLCAHPELLLPFGEFVSWLDDAFTLYNHTPHSGTGMRGRTPAEVFAAERIERRTPDPFAFALVFYRCETRVLDRNGVRVSNMVYTPVDPDGSITIKYLRQPVKVLIDPRDVSHAILCNSSEQFLCEAVAHELATHDVRDAVTEEALRRTARQRRAILDQVREQAGGISGARLRSWWKHNAARVMRQAAAKHREDETRMVASGGNPLTVVIPAYSKLGRDIDAFRSEYTRPPTLSAAQLELAATAEDHTDAYLDDVLASPSRPRSTGGAFEDDDPIHLAAERDRLAEVRERRRKELEGECLECSEPVWAGLFCRSHFRLSDG